MATEKMAERDDAEMFFVGKVPFLPHYDKPDVYVAPGGSEWSLAELENLKAMIAPVFLWPRHWQQKRRKEQGYKVKAQVKAKVKARPMAKPEIVSADLVLDYLKKEGSPMSSTEIAREMNWSSNRVREALNKLHDMEAIAPWGTRNNRNEPQRWIAK